MKYLSPAYEKKKKPDHLSRSEWDEVPQKTLGYVETLRRNGHLVSTQPAQSLQKAAADRVSSGQLSGTDEPSAANQEHGEGMYSI